MEGGENPGGKVQVRFNWGQVGFILIEVCFIEFELFQIRLNLIQVGVYS